MDDTQKLASDDCDDDRARLLEILDGPRVKELKANLKAQR
jgi:hypothetical protein